MAKKKTTTYFECSSCGYTQPRWMGRCPECGTWNSFVEKNDTPNTTTPSVYHTFKENSAQAIPLSSVNPMEGKRLITEITEFDRVLGGGAMKRSVILLGGEPGIGKSTLLLQTAVKMAATVPKARVLYVSGEESAAQIRARADRLFLDTRGIEILCTTRLEDINRTLNAVNPICVIIDSIQTVFSSEAGAIPGTVNQLKLCATDLSLWAKERDTILFMSAHVTKDGGIAGPKALEHLVDTVILFEQNNDQIRFLRAQKNRFGSVDELGIFSMTEKGLIGVEDPSSLFIIRRENGMPSGIAVVPVFEGSRVFLVEIQALTVPAKASLSRVYSDRVDNARVSRVAAVLEKQTGLSFSDQDIYINVAGGVRLTESAIDAGLAAALYSARTDIAVGENIAISGELSLAGEIRPVNRLAKRIKAAQTLGFTKLFIPEEFSDTKNNNTLIYTKNIKVLLKTLFK